jgi:hypothetical protein
MPGGNKTSLPNAEKHGMSKYTNKNVLDMMMMSTKGDRVIDIAKHFNSDPKHIGKILNGVIWNSVTGLPKKIKK